MAATPRFFERHVNEFINDWRAIPIIEVYVRNRLQQLGQRRKDIGIMDDVENGTAFSMEHGWGGRNARPEGSNGVTKGGVNVDYGIFDPELLPLASWKTASLRDRIDAVIIHEMLEYNSRAATTAARHRVAILRSASTKKDVSKRARKILRDFRSWFLQRTR